MEPHNNNNNKNNNNKNNNNDNNNNNNNNNREDKHLEGGRPSEPHANQGAKSTNNDALALD